MRRLKHSLIVLVVVLSFLNLAFAGSLRLVEGATLFYRCARVSSSRPSDYATWNASIKVIALNQTALVLQSNNTESISTLNIEYINGIPTYADYLTALFYLPPECMAQNLQGLLNWTTRIRTRTPAAVTDWKAQSMNFTVEAGNFQSINITLVLAGMDSGALTMIYDVDSGIMIYEQWIPMSGSQIYGDIIILSLTAITSSLEAGQTIINLISTTAVFAIPAVIFSHEARKSFQKRQHRKRLNPHNIEVKGSFPRKPFYVILAGGLLSLASIMLPWSQLAGSDVYLPLSLSSALAGSAPFFTSSSTFLATSLLVHASAIMAWVSIAIRAYGNSRFVPQVIAIVSGALAVASAIIFAQTGWTTSWGVLAIVLAGALALFGAAIMIIGKKNRTSSSARVS